jgi:hypothetical protein
MAKITLEQNTAALKRWRTRLKRAMSMLDKLERQRKRLEATAVVTTSTRPQPLAKPAPLPEQVQPKRPRGHADLRDLNNTFGPAIREAAVDAGLIKPTPDLDLPPFLDRSKIEPATVELAQEIAETKKLKTKGRIEKMKAKKRGDLKKMPLGGQAALDFIKNG